MSVSGHAWLIVLTLLKGASDKEIRKQYRELSKTMHPDKGGDPEKLKELGTLWEPRWTGRY